MPRVKTELRDMVRTDRQLRRVLGAPGAGAARQPCGLVCRPARVAALAGAGERGCLVLSDGQIVAVLVRVADEPRDEMQDGNGETAAEGWFLEAGFGRCAAPVPPLFGSLAEALAWVCRRLAGEVAAKVGLPGRTHAGRWPDA